MLRPLWNRHYIWTSKCTYWRTHSAKNDFSQFIHKCSDLLNFILKYVKEFCTDIRTGYLSQKKTWLSKHQLNCYSISSIQFHVVLNHVCIIFFSQMLLLTNKSIYSSQSKSYYNHMKHFTVWVRVGVIQCAGLIVNQRSENSHQTIGPT